MNVSDSEKIAAILRPSGYSQTSDHNQADLIILNTCSVRAKAEQKVYSELGRLKHLKRGERQVILAVGGCIAQQEGDKLLSRLPYVDFVFGTHNLHQLPELVRSAEAGDRKAAVNFRDSDERLDLFPSDTGPGSVTRFVTVMQGCDNYCSYCIVPYVRGREVSRRSADIIAEIEGMAANGVKEVTLLGQNVNSYGVNTPEEPDFAGLLRLISDIEGIERIRFTTSHPKDISPPLIACFSELPKLCSHIHLPAQSGSDRILKAMGRRYTRAHYLQKIAELKGARPDIQITGDMIVGFPGETEADFRQTLDLMREVGYADLFSFIYSRRPGTKAAEIPELLTYDEKQERLERLQNLQKELTFSNSNTFTGTRQTLLVEGESKRGGMLTGRTSGNRVVNFHGEGITPGTMVEVKITRAYPNSLLGEIC
jgi:tRNA-2-methylthio-N6-dimethylallyladenosine synthase